jgi:hypothetical protein
MSWGVCAPARQHSKHLYHGLDFELALLCVLGSGWAAADVTRLLVAPAVPAIAAAFASGQRPGLLLYGLLLRPGFRDCNTSYKRVSWVINASRGEKGSD